ncbi:MAG: hypothetical protein IPK63_22705 [Candidatus Competibacteraceae bacterium]|nr:hypothetical protein [Candidatus Competibacteraceae bacterium]
MAQQPFHSQNSNQGGRGSGGFGGGGGRGTGGGFGDKPPEPKLADATNSDLFPV